LEVNVMPIPSQVDLRRPLLGILVGGTELELSKMVHLLAQSMGLSVEEPALRDPSDSPGAHSAFYDRLCWARWDLAQAELVSIPRTGFTRIMQRGIEALRVGPAVLSDDYLERYPEYADYLERMRSGHEPGPHNGDIQADGTPLPPIVDPHVWIEKTIVEGRGDRQEGENRLGKALWSPKLSKANTDIYHFMRDVAIGDIVLHLTDNRAITGISEAVSVAEDFGGLPETEWSEGDSYRVRLASYTKLDPPLDRDLFFASPYRERLQAIIKGGQKNLFYSSAPALNQGAYLTPVPPALLRVLNDAYKSISGRPLVMQNVGEGDSQTAVAEDAALFDRLVEATHWSESSLSELVSAIKNEDHPSRQIILAGPPGTSKTFVAKKLVDYLTDGEPGLCHIVQFHPSYSYEQFVEGLRPSVVNGAIQFSPEQGIVLKLADKCRASSDKHYLIIDEFNRANLSRVLGELLYLFEYRDSEIDLPYTQKFALPKNLYFIATMNTADRSIRSIDSALRRRFDVFECPADVDVLRRYYASIGHQNDVPDLFDGFVALNEQLREQGLDEHHAVGHAFFMAEHLTADFLRGVWKRKIAPLLGEFFFDTPDIARGFEPTRLWPSLL